jgi:HK97 family phage prohead protease
VKTETRNRIATFGSDDSKFELTGIAAPYNTPTDVGAFHEQIARGAFTRALREKQECHALVNHDQNQVLGRIGNGTLILSDSPEGLRFVIKLNPESQAHRDLYASVKRGDVHEMSFAFKTAPNGEQWERRKGVQLRTLTDVDLFDISVVTNPAYKNGTSVSARAAGADGKALDEFHRRRLQEQEYEILKDAPGFIITKDLRVIAMSQEEVDLRTDARNRLRAAEQATEIVRDAAREEIEKVKRSLGL